MPADNQVTTSAVPKQDEATTAVLFLVGKGNLTRDFNVSFATAAPDGTYALRLEPRLPERDYDWLEIVVDRQTLQIRSLTAGDRQGGQSTFHLSNFKENPGIADGVFAFSIPEVPMSSMLAARRAEVGRAALILLGAAWLAGCATTSGFRAGPARRAGAGLRPRRRRVHQGGPAAAR